MNIQPEGFAVVGLAAFFTGVVRAPVTGIVLVTEMTANVTMLLPMLGACFTAMLLPTVLRDAPIYDSLREHTLQRERVLRDKKVYGKSSQLPTIIAIKGRMPDVLMSADGIKQLKAEIVRLMAEFARLKEECELPGR